MIKDTLVKLGSFKPSLRFIYAFVVLLTLANVGVRARFLHSPPSSVFDEAYYVKYSTSYCCSHQFYSDLHPPLPKLIFGIPGFFSEYKGDYPFSSKEDPAPEFAAFHLPIAPMRGIAVAVGSSVPVLMFALGLTIGLSPIAALLPALWISCENATVLHSSFVLLDQFLVAGLLVAMIAFLRGLTTPESQPGRRRGWAALCGLGTAVAVGTKLTGLCVLLPFALFAVFALRRGLLSARQLFTQLLWFLCSFFVIYIGAWALHEKLLLSENYDTATNGFWATIPFFFDRLVWNHWNMLSGHFSLGHTDTYGSRWWQWLTGYHPLLFWQRDGHTKYFFPNPGVWSASAFVLLALAAARFLARRMGARMPRLVIPWRAAFILTTAAANFLPNILVKRVLYLYHFMPAMALLLIFDAWMFEAIGWLGWSTRRQKIFTLAAAIVPALFFIAVLPFSHGLHTPWGEMLKDALDFEINWR